MGNPVTWFEINGPQPEQTAKFYAELFGWETQPVPGGYILIDTHAGGGINGGFGQPHAAMYAAVDDLQKYLERAESIGGRTAMPPTQVDEHTSIAAFADPQGTVFGLYTYQE